MLSRCCSIISIVVLVLLLGCGGPGPGSSTDGSESPDLSAASGSIGREKKWYEGGDLHRAVIGEWKAATYENKLATSADMVANIKQFSSMEEMKSAAEELEQMHLEGGRRPRSGTTTCK